MKVRKLLQTFICLTIIFSLQGLNLDYFQQNYEYVFYQFFE